MSAEEKNNQLLAHRGNRGVHNVIEFEGHDFQGQLSAVFRRDSLQ